MATKKVDSVHLPFYNTTVNVGGISWTKNHPDGWFYSYYEYGTIYPYERVLILFHNKRVMEIFHNPNSLNTETFARKVLELSSFKEELKEASTWDISLF